MWDNIDQEIRKIVKIPAHAGCGKRPSYASPAEKTEKLCDMGVPLCSPW